MEILNKKNCERHKYITNPYTIIVNLTLFDYSVSCHVELCHDAK